MPRRSTGTHATRPLVLRAFLFSDLREYTSFVEARGDRAAAELLGRYRALVRREVSRQKGAEVKTEGDSFYVVFESPSAALNCAVAIQRRADAQARSQPDASLRIGIGLHAGETVASDDQFVGSAVNIASRLAGSAMAGEIVISDTVRGLVRTATPYEMDDRGGLQLKGMRERVRAWSVRWRDEPPVPATPIAGDALPEPAGLRPLGPASGQLLCPVVVGRADELARVEALLDLAREARGQTLLVAGEAGVGKSAFVRRVIEAATSSGARVLYGATLESEAGLPYGPFIAAIRSAFRRLPQGHLGQALADAAPDLAQLFPELGRPANDKVAEHHRLSVAFHNLFRAFASEAPTLIVLEDLHWSDESSHHLLHYLARELRDARVLVIATYRNDEMHRRHPLLRTVATMQRERLVSEITLQRLSREEVAELVRLVFATRDPDVDVTADFRDAIYERSEGNPFFTEELLKSLVESGDVYLTATAGWDRKPIAQLRIPSSVREAVRLRAERLSEGAQATLSAAAVIGQRFGFELLRTVRGVDEAALEGHVRELIEQQLAIELDTPDEYAFRHALTREVAYDDLLARERRRLHRAVAQALAAGQHIEPALVAHHLIAAADEAAALPYVLESAERALRADAPREAAAHFERAVAIGLAEARTGPTLERLADAYYLFDFALSRKTAEEATRFYRQRGDALGLSRMLRLVSRNVWQQGDSNRAVEMAQEAIAALGGTDESPELGRAISHLAQLKMVAREDEEAIGLASRALAQGQRQRDDWTIANAAITKGVSLANAGGDKKEARDLLERGRTLAVEHDLAETALRGYNNMVVAADRLNLDPTEAARLLDEGIAYAERHGIEHGTLHALSAERAYVEGRWDESLVIGARVQPTSVWYSFALIAHAMIAAGREGPAAGLVILHDFADEASRQEEAQRFLPPTVTMTVLCVCQDDAPRAAGWLDRIEQWGRKDRGVQRGLITGGGPADFVSGWNLLLCGAYLRRADWIEWLDGALSTLVLPAATAAHDARGALQAGDQALLALSVEACLADQERRGKVPQPQSLILAARAARAFGMTLGPEWRTPIERARATAERAKASWYLAELDTLATAIGSA
jgi:class 3 adenylate cyclase